MNASPWETKDGQDAIAVMRDAGLLTLLPILDIIFDFAMRRDGPCVPVRMAQADARSLAYRDAARVLCSRNGYAFTLYSPDAKTDEGLPTPGEWSLLLYHNGEILDCFGGLGLDALWIAAVLAVKEKT